eukprot:3064433-Pleurochrysis_carterae.AAC.1
MAAERQQHRIRHERAERDLRESREPKSRTESDWIRRERPELLRCVSLRPREGRQWTFGVPPQGFIHVGPEPPSLEACDQRTRG